MNVRKPWNVRLITLCITCILLPVTACPPQCSCIWQNGKRCVNCSDLDLKAIPSSLDFETQVLNFTGNDLQVLQKDHFYKLNLVHLQKINLKRCKLEMVDDRAFYGLRNLVELDLSSNYLTIIPFDNFKHFGNLMRLLLNSNPITTIKSNSFCSLPVLNTLELRYCKIKVIERDAFSGLHHLKSLQLNNNKISNIQGENLFPDTLQEISLQNNDWNCDCHLRNFHSWLLNFKKVLFDEPICSFPERLRHHTITNVTENELACLPQMNSTNVILERNFSSNVTLECLVKAVPEAKIAWLYQGQIIHNDSSDMPNAHDVDFVENGSTDRKYELYLFNIEDNGTYTCLAENPAGRSLANFTITILAKEEPVVAGVTCPQNYSVVIVTIIISVTAIVAVVLLKFKTATRSRKKNERGKGLCNQNLPSSRDNDIPKNNSLIEDAHSHRALNNTVQKNHDYELSNVYQSNIMQDFVDRNLYLINDEVTLVNNVQNKNTALSVCKDQSAGCGIYQEETTFTTPIIENRPKHVTWQDQQNMNATKNTCPPPKMSNYSMVGPFNETLPRNRPKGQKCDRKFMNDSEFNITQLPYPNFESFDPGNITLTPRNRQIAFVCDGTVHHTKEFVPSPPEGYKSEPIQYCTPPNARSCCVSPKGTCAVMVPNNVLDTPSCSYQIETRCVNTQSSGVQMPGEGTESVLKPSPQVSNAMYVANICSENPHECYVGDDYDIDFEI